MIGPIIGDLLGLLVILPHAICFSRQEKQEITALYNDKTEIISAYTRLERSQENICAKQLFKWYHYELSTSTREEDIVTVVERVPDGTMAVTVDGQTMFDIPYYIDCMTGASAHRPMILISTDPDDRKCKLARILNADRIVEGRAVYQTREMFLNTILKNAYTNQSLTVMHNKYVYFATSQPNMIQDCNGIRGRLHLRQIRHIENGFIQMGYFTLYLNESEMISLPGVLTCIFLQGANRTRKIMYFVIDLPGTEWIRVYKHKTNPPNPLVYVQQGFVLEKHLINEYRGLN